MVVPFKRYKPGRSRYVENFFRFLLFFHVCAGFPGAYLFVFYLLHNSGLFEALD